MTLSRFSSIGRFGLAALTAISLGGCLEGGGSGGGVTIGGVTFGGSSIISTAPSNLVQTSKLTAAQWQALTPKIDPTSVSVSINGAPVVKFKVTDAAGNPLAGLGNKGALGTSATSSTLASLVNIQFTLAKLVPSSNGSPSKWVSYLVTRPVTNAEKAGTVAATASCDSTTAPTVCGTYPTSDSQGTMVDNGDGSYQYTFYRDPKQAAAQVASLIDSVDGLSKKAALGDVSYDATATHRLAIIVTGNQPGTGTNVLPGQTGTAPTAVPLVKTLNFTYDFRPDGQPVTVTRNIVSKDSCTECHDGKGIGHAGTNVKGWQVGRNDPALCMTCHTDQIRYSFDQEATYADSTHMALTGTTRQTQAVIDGRAVGNYPNLIHKMHMGDQLLKQGYNFNADAAGQFNTKRFPQDPRNCTKCHDNASDAIHPTTDGNNWMNKPSRLACGACHDGINFATGGGVALNGQYPGHVGGAQADDSLCATCHNGTTIPVYHQTTIPSAHNPTTLDNFPSLQYVIKSAILNANRQLVVDFQILQGITIAKNGAVSGGTPATLNTYAGDPTAPMLTGYAGCTPANNTSTPKVASVTTGPSLKVAYSTGQDGIANPSDWNMGHDSMYLCDAWAGGNGNSLIVKDATAHTYEVVMAATTPTLSSPTATLKASHSLAVPTDAHMVTALMSDSFTVLPAPKGTLFHANVAEHAGAAPGIPAMFTVTGKDPDGTTNVARRQIFDKARCNNCHDRLGTSPYFHNGNYSIEMCAICHTPNQGSPWSASFRTWVHGIHGASQRTVPFTWHGTTTYDYSKLEYPGVLKDCQQCHLAGTYDFSASQYTGDLISRMLPVVAVTGTTATAATPAFSSPTNPDGSWAYGILPNTIYGSGWSIDTTGATNGGKINALVAATTQASNLVSSPITAVCSSCHDDSTSTAHMQANGGTFYGARSSVVGKTESCLLCHGSGAVADIAVMHQK